MVNTATHIDGQAIAIEQETQDADEPPLAGPAISAGIIHDEKSYNKEKFHDLTAAGTLESKNGTLTSISSWDGSPEKAHLVDATDIAAHLGVDPRYVHSLMEMSEITDSRTGMAFQLLK
jgi:hypothetical protein